MKTINFVLLFCIFGGRNLIIEANELSQDKAVKEDCTALAKDDETLLVFSTLRGGLTAVDIVTSEIRWSIEDEPAVKAEVEPHSPLPRFLPNPKDGSLYQLGRMGDLKKLPFTVQQLVASAPCRSSDGILYSGKKSDLWYLIDPKTGYREKVMGSLKNHKFDEVEKLENGNSGCTTTCSVYLGRTQYTVMMLDSFSKNKNLKPWNITFYDYSSHVMAPELSNDYGYIHLTASSSGLIATFNKQGTLLWKKDLSSPVVSVFLLGSEGLLSVPFTTVADNVLQNIVKDSIDETVNEIKLIKSIYIGEDSHGFFALPSLVDENTARLSSGSNIKLIAGPESKNNRIRPNSIYITDYLTVDNNNFPPKIYKEEKISSNYEEMENHKLAFIKTTDNCFEINQKSDVLPQSNIKKIFTDTQTWLAKGQNNSNYQFILVTIFLTITLFLFINYSFREIRIQKFNGTEYSNIKKNYDVNFNNYKELINLGDGLNQVGKIIFNTQQILGKGCEGTFVFRGTFEERNVAVKRLLPECFTFADREVALLRESDTHENVIRYFCTEEDRQFRYIALELCAATLQDFIENFQYCNLPSVIDVWEILKQATSGLSHLHSLSIVHRDIKPQNVLISFPDNNNVVRAMISDFGLCKKLNHEKISFSQQSGITGTEGWIAPEMVLGRRVTTAVDIFSLGCVFYYVLTEGHHAYGDSLRRQANILANDYDLYKLQIENNKNVSKSKLILAEQLISDMIQYESEKRPDAKAIYNHPLFWNEEKILAFLQDVSDRVEKLTIDVEPLSTLEKNGSLILYEDWTLHLEKQILDDLKKYRSYIGGSVRDLLRALRNKKHHYHELSPEAQDILGNIPKDFTKYWISKFPHLLQHAYHSISYCSNENIFKCYYYQKYKFSKPCYFYQKNDTELSNLINNNKLYSNIVNPIPKIHKKFFNKKYKNTRKFLKENVNNKSLGT